MPGAQGSGVLNFISIFMLVLDILKAILIPIILFRGTVLVNVLIKKYRVDKKESKESKESKLSAVSEKPVKSKEAKTSETSERSED